MANPDRILSQRDVTAMAAIDHVRTTDLTIPLLSAARTNRITYDTDRRRFLVGGLYADDATSNELVAMHEDCLITTWRAADEPGLVLMKPTHLGDDVLDPATEG